MSSVAKLGLLMLACAVSGTARAGAKASCPDLNGRWEAKEQGVLSTFDVAQPADCESITMLVGARDEKGVETDLGTREATSEWQELRAPSQPGDAGHPFTSVLRTRLGDEGLVEERSRLSGGRAELRERTVFSVGESDGEDRLERRVQSFCPGAPTEVSSDVSIFYPRARGGDAEAERVTHVERECAPKPVD